MPAFSKAAGCRAEPYGPKGVARTVGPAFLSVSKKGGTDVPLLGQHKTRCPRAWNKKVVKYFKKLGNIRVLFYTRVVKYLARW